MNKVLKKLFLLLMGFLFVFYSENSIIELSFASNKAVTNNEPTIGAKAAILVDAETGQVLYSKRAYDRMYPASTTKMLTALISIENLKINKVIIPSNKACAIPYDGSTVGIKPGEKITVSNLLYALLLNSSCEAANILAEAVSGNIKAFAVKMNKRARELGCTGTNFVNPSGYPDKNHYTTAYDLSRIAICAMKNPVFRKIVGTYAYKIPPTNKHPKGIYLVNTNELINKYNGGGYYYKFATGIKTGTADSSGPTLVSGAKNKNLELIAVTLNAPDRYSDSIKLLNYGFNNFKRVQIAKKDSVLSVLKIDNTSKSIKLAALNNISCLLKYNLSVKPNVKFEYKKIKLPVIKNSIIGTAKYYVNNTCIAEVKLYAKETVLGDEYNNVSNSVYGK